MYGGRTFWDAENATLAVSGQKRLFPIEGTFFCDFVRCNFEYIPWALFEQLHGVHKLRKKLIYGENSRLENRFAYGTLGFWAKFDFTGKISDPKKCQKMRFFDKIRIP